MWPGGTNDVSELTPIGMRHDEQESRPRLAECQEPIILIGMIGIKKEVIASGSPKTVADS